MKGTKELKTNKGITLIALVITIIVMLILVAVIISMAVNGGLFEYARNAGAQTNAAIANEQELANLEEGLTVDELIDKYTQNSNGCGKCTDGYITGYVCSLYGKSCNVISSSYEERGCTINCKYCGFYNNSSYAAGEMECPACEALVSSVPTVKLSDCSHFVYEIAPVLESFLCPTCSGEEDIETISFTIAGESYTAKNGMNWELWVKEGMYLYDFQLSGPYVYIHNSQICYDDGSKVNNSSPIIARTRVQTGIYV